MTEIQESKLPGVGVRHDFVTQRGDRVGVISHHNGQRELLIYDQEDPDFSRASVRLQEAEANIMAELLGAVHVAQSVTNVQQMIKGLAIDWIPIKPAWAGDGQTIAALMIRTRTGASIVAVIRGDETTPSPTPDFKLQSDDLVVVVGTAEGIQKTYNLLQGDG